MAFVVPTDNRNLTERVREATELARKLDWRVCELVVMPVAKLTTDRRSHTVIDS